jgi:hypothetical protein
VPDRDPLECAHVIGKIGARWFRFACGVALNRRRYPLQPLLQLARGAWLRR